MTARRCTWCKRRLPRGLRADAETCSQPCRQAKHRFKVAPAELLNATDRPRRFGYADPPYPGLAWRYYRAAEVDHAALILQLVADFPDGWALSTSAAALPDVLRLCPAGARVCPWVHGARAGRARRARNAWEPLIVVGGRPAPPGESVAEDLRDVLIWGGRQRSHPGALVGMKPAQFCEWLFRLLGARRGDQLVDLFPGSGAVRRAWDLFTAPDLLPDASRQVALPLELGRPARRVAPRGSK